MKKLFIQIPALFFCAVVMCVSCKNREENNEETWLLYARASAAYAQGRFDESAAMLQELRSFTPALVLRAKALYFCGRGEEAEQLLRRTLRRNPGSGEASLFLARILREQGKDGEARHIAEALLKDNPQDIRALRLASDLAGNRGDTEEAAALLDRAVEASAETALVYVDRARLRWIAGNGSSALEDLRRAELLLPWNTSLVRGIRDLKTVIAEAQK
ncbi:MAG: tetratricopeptide repeat protein [Spirochaetaceae bacterium]|jgi:tetratricopeptide (TPR) repeat protein|nr:tetratricopeptide repeat protein [Spirochaetaceae bacterium]